MLLFIFVQRRGSLKSLVYYAVCGTAQGLMVTRITEAPHSARRAKQLFYSGATALTPQMKVFNRG